MHLCNNGTLAQYNYTNIINTKTRKSTDSRFCSCFCGLSPLWQLIISKMCQDAPVVKGLFIPTRKIFVHFLYTQHFASKVWQFYTFALMIIFCDHLDICLKQILFCRRNFTRSSSPWTSATFGPPPAHKGILFLLFMFIFSSNIK